MLGVSRSRFYQLAARADFPPATVLESVKVYDAIQMRAFALQRQLGQPVLEALGTYQHTGVIARAAFDVDVDPSTIRRWMRLIGVKLPAER